MSINAERQLPAAPAAALGGATPTRCFASVTLWRGGDFFLEVHCGNFETHDAAELFGGRDWALQDRFGALFMCDTASDFFIPDGAIQIYRSVTARSYTAADMTLDDLMEHVHIDDMECLAMGSTTVARGEPIIARASFPQAANDG
jgi:hypothetical protein